MKFAAILIEDGETTGRIIMEEYGVTWGELQVFNVDLLRDVTPARKFTQVLRIILYEDEVDVCILTGYTSHFTIR